MRKFIRRHIPFLFILPSFVGFLLFYILPFMVSAGYAFMDRPIRGSFVGFDNLIGLLSNKSYMLGLKNTAFFMGVGVPLCMALSLSVALLTKNLRKNKKFISLIFLLPLVIPSGSMAFFWRNFFITNGFLNKLLFDTGLIYEPVNWLDSFASRWIIAAIFIWKNIGYNMVLFLAGLASIPREYYEQAYMCGAGKIRAFFSVTCVYLMPTFLLVTTMSVVNSFKIFREIYSISGVYPHEGIYLLQHFMNNTFQNLNYPKLTSAMMLMVIALTVFILSLQKLERRFSSS